MSKEKVILYGIVIFILSSLVYFSYISQQSAATKKTTQTVSSHKSLKTTETEDDEVVQETKDETSGEVAVPITVQNNDTQSEQAETEENVDDSAPTVTRDKLIGGADVEWIEPKPKDPNNKFGEPPL